MDRKKNMPVVEVYIQDITRDVVYQVMLYQVLKLVKFTEKAYQATCIVTYYDKQFKS